MFDKILIANRGEIACRIIRSARKMGIRTVAVYSDADRNALHVDMADEAIHIGPAPSRDSYLQIDKVIEAARRSGAQAIHPGYGFLSESASFCQACKDSNIVFIGPSPAAIEAMGSKSAAKRIMEVAGVPLVPGYHGDDQSNDVLQRSADAMGYPVLLKAAAGGGGKGMRQVWHAEEFEDALAAARRESRSAFGDDAMLVEKYLTQPRHVEIQVFCDSLGNAVYLFERDCSVQRRHQKIIEEAPAPGMTPQLRDAMGQAAIKAAQAIDYTGAGTVEFLLDRDGAFYFMEMNTRLQVEHPVTEMISGQDLVEWQLRVAAGEPLPLNQEQLHISGHAFEARLYAEDPDNDFLPATGTLAFLKAPDTSDYVRIDSGVHQGDDVSVYYDPMIAKLIVWGQDRDQALARLAQALSEYRISGITTNIDFLHRLVTSTPFREADLDTGFIDKHHNAIFREGNADLEKHLPLAALYLLLKRQACAQQQALQSADATSPWNHVNAWRSATDNLHRLDIQLHERPYTVTAQQTQQGHADSYHIRYNDQAVLAQGVLQGNRLRANLNGHQMTVHIADHDGRCSLFTQARALNFREARPHADNFDVDQSKNALQAPMNGTLVALLVKPGSIVQKNDALLVMEAMKMEHTIRAPAAGTVKAFYFQPGELVDDGTELVDFIAD